MRFSGKIAVISGAAKGIGRAAAEGFAREGACVVGVDLDGPVLQEVINGIKANGGTAVAVLADVAKDADAQRIAQEAVQAFGGSTTCAILQASKLMALWSKPTKRPGILPLM